MAGEMIRPQDISVVLLTSTGFVERFDADKNTIAETGVLENALRFRGEPAAREWAARHYGLGLSQDDCRFHWVIFR